MPETPSPHPSDGQPIDPTAPVFDATVVRIPVELDTTSVQRQIEAIADGVASSFKNAIDKAVSDSRKTSVSVEIDIDTDKIAALVREAIEKASASSRNDGFQRVSEGQNGKPGVVLDTRPEDVRRWPELMSKLDEVVAALNAIIENQGSDSGGP